MKKRAGDTLIEVTIAIGIFSMVAIAVVAVMNGGTSNSQTALETTLAREEIDTQAEALRFIQSAYIADKDADNAPKNTAFERAWSKINERIVKPSVSAEYDVFNEIIENTSSCDVAYNNDKYRDFLAGHAFIVDPKTMELITPESNTNLAPFYPASTYPRLVMNNQIDEGGNTLSDKLVDNSLTSKLARVEGLYILAVQDNKTTMMTDKKNENTENSSAYIDFYIRTCWYGIGGDSSSNISTVIRLYNPDATAIATEATGIQIEYNSNGGTGRIEGSFVNLNESTVLSSNRNGEFLYDGYHLAGWSTNPQATPSQVKDKMPGTFEPGETFKAPKALSLNNKVTLYAIWQTDYFLKYDPNGYNAWHPSDSDCDKNKGCKIPNHTIPDRTGEGYVLKGWCTKKPTANDGSCEGDLYKDGGQYDKPLPMTNAVRQNDHYYYITLYAVWDPHYTLYFYDTDEKTVLCKLEKDNVATFAISECDKEPTDKGGGHTFQGWSPNDQEPYYNKTGTNTSLTIPNSGNRTVKLYPVWRVSVKFSSEGWTPHHNGTYDDGTICCRFQYTIPSYERYYRISKGQRFGCYGEPTDADRVNVAPDDGYVVFGWSGSNRIEILDRGIINMQGYCYSAANDYVSYTVGKDDTFELSANMNTTGMVTHPEGGYASLSIGPIVAYIKDGAVTSSCQGINGGTHYFRGSPVITLKIDKHGDSYSVSAGNKDSSSSVLKSCTVPTNSSVEVRYTMVHGSHGCASIFNVQLTDINMQQYKKN